MNFYQIVLFAAEEAKKETGLLDAIIGNIGNILLVIAFGAGLWLINHLSNKIKADDALRKEQEEAARAEAEAQTGEKGGETQSEQPSEEPLSEERSEQPSEQPSEEPSEQPSEEPSEQPSEE